MARWLFLIIICVVLLLLAVPAWAQQQCAPVAMVERALENAGQQQIAVGLSSGRSVRLYANSNTRAWTVLVVNGLGVACRVVSGTNLDTVQPPAPGRDS